MAIKLNEKRVRARKPQEGIRAEFHKLPKDQAYTLEELVDKWGVGSETIRRHANELKCLKYVEVEPHDWRQMVLHPETAAKYKDA